MATGLRIKIGDFGISKILTTQRGDFDGLSNNGSTFVGTPFYTSPEIVRIFLLKILYTSRFFTF